MDTVQLVLVNNSKQAGNMIIFHQYDDHHTPLAWFSKYLYSRARVTFSWKPWEWCFVWSATADTEPGTELEMGQVVPADMTTNRAVAFSYDAGHRTFYFKEERPGTDSPYQPFTLLLDATIPMNAATVGIGLAERATYAVQAMPNMNVQITPRSTTWVTFGKAEAGHFFDVKDMLEPVQIEFPSNVNSMTVILNEDNTWTVKNNIMMVDDEGIADA